MPPSLFRRRGLISAAAALALLAVTPYGARASSPTGAAAATGAGTAVTRTVTLITGDTVTVKTLSDGRSVATVQRPHGLTGGVRTRTVGKELYVYPDEVLPYVAAGVLDQRLFDVTALIADGYDDAHTGTLPLIVQYGTAVAAKSAAPAVPGLTATRQLSSIRGAAATVSHAGAAGMWQSLAPAGTGASAQARSLSAPAAFADGVTHIWLDGRVKATLADSTAQIGAPDAWAAGTDGKGVDVAVLDTGIDTQHPDLVGQVDASQSFVPGEDIEDRVGHGTHTASTIAGTGAASAGKEKGVAPGAHLLVGKVLDDTGYGQDSWVLAGMQWAAQTEHAKVISMSLGDPSVVGDGSDPMSQAVDSLSASTGALFVIAAGNSGSAGVSSPGSASSALTVGAVDSGDNLAYFSSTGPRAIDGDPKPEITAPGVDILAARSQYMTDGSGYYTTMSGTSMATPHVAGTAALVAEEHPDWTGQQIKDDLVSTAALTPQIAVGDGGSGRVDARAAVLGTVHASASAWSGYYAWPHTDDKPGVRTVTYSNTGSAPVTLDLAADVTAPAGAFTLSASSVTVPANGTAQVTVAGDPAKAPYGNTDGQLVATDASSGAVVAHTLIGIDNEAEMYNLTVDATDRAGAPLGGSAVLFEAGSQDAQIVTVPDSGKLTLRLPKGEYSLLLEADLPGAAGPADLGLAMLSAPQIQLTADRTVALDAQQAQRVSAVTPKRSESQETRLEWYRAAGGTSFDESDMIPVKYTSLWAQTTAPVTDGSFSFVARWRDAEPMLTVSGAGQSFTDLLQQIGATPLPAGSSRLAAVYAGQGASADYAGLDARGKAVVVDDNSAVAPTDQAAAAVAAGAKLLLVVSGAPGRVSNWYGAADYSANSPIAVASVTTTEGRALEAAITAGTRATTLSVGSQPVPSYAYDLVERHDGAVPAQLTYRPKASQLAEVDNRFASPSGAQTGSEGRYDMQDFDSYGTGFDLVQQLPATRTDWVTPGAGFTWYDEASSQTVQERAPLRAFTAGSRQPYDWFSPVLHPRLNTSTWLPQRNADWMTVNIPGWGDAMPGDSGFDQGNGQLNETLWLYQGSTLIKKSNYQAIYTDVPASATPVPYRLVVATNQVGAFPYTPGSRTEWTFTSGTTDPSVVDTLPLIQLDYGVATDLTGRASRSTTLTLTASELAEMSRTSKITGGTLEVSYDDGSSWKALKLTRTATGSWTARLTAPRSALVASLRATARDAAGNTVTQTVLEAFGLK
ncbi:MULTISPECIES: S8 family serine peptidase [Streptacidiphilus]|uniref:S8 family serine peptidase n=1 Tax=Streptacidiphilus cavernicola TaxID=3342716 RepID=A0ABV6UZ62_9ACTN|nr:S8 family serine peptidase [Streptacidiphilus jeojiense]